MFRTIDDPDISETLNGIFEVSNTILDDTRFDLDKRYQINKDISSTKDVKYEGVVIVKDPDQFNSASGDSGIGNDNSPGVFIAGTRAFSSDNNPWTDEDDLLNPVTGTENALVTRSEQIGIGEVKFLDSIRIDGLGTDILTGISSTADDYSHKLPVVINGETYFLLVAAN